MGERRSSLRIMLVEKDCVLRLARLDEIDRGLINEMRRILPPAHAGSPSSFMSNPTADAVGYKYVAPDGAC
jgi:hypothetical protein